MRRHGWERPLHHLQMVGMTVYCFLVVAFYVFLGLFLGSRTAEITVTLLFSLAAASVMLLFVRCTAIDPTDKTRFRKKKKGKRTKAKGLPKFNHCFILGQIVLRFLRRIERKILLSFIRRKYLLDPLKLASTSQVEPLLPFPLVIKNQDDDAISPQPMEDDDLISFCTLCDFEVKKHSKHCRTCNRCVEGFDHHCRWLNNCVGKKNYTTFILLMVFVLFMLVLEGGTAVAIFVRCFVDKRGIEQELERKLHGKFPREVLATVSVLMVLMTGYSSAAIGQLFFFHVVLIRKGIRTYDYIMAMKEENQNQPMEMDPFNTSDFSSDYSTDSDSPEKPMVMSRFICSGQAGVNQTRSPKRLSIKVEGGGAQPSVSKNEGFRASINPWKLIKMSREKALIAAEKARERLMRQNAVMENGSLKPLPLEKKHGPSAMQDNYAARAVSATSAGSFAGSPQFSSPRRRFSGSAAIFSSSAAAPPSQPKYKSDLDVKLTEASEELEMYIPRQLLCTVVKNDPIEASPR